MAIKNKKSRLSKNSRLYFLRNYIWSSRRLPTLSSLAERIKADYNTLSKSHQLKFRFFQDSEQMIDCLTRFKKVTSSSKMPQIRVVR